MRILYLVNTPGFFVSHRIALAQAAREGGFEIHVSTPLGPGVERIKAEGFRFHPLTLTRRGWNPLVEVQALEGTIELYARVRPTLGHNMTLKPMVFGGIAAQRVGITGVVQAVTGLGHLFTSKDLAPRTSQRVIRPLMKLAFSHPNLAVVFQNQGDKDLLESLGICSPEAGFLVPGSGVDTREFIPVEEPPGALTVILPSRMLWSKGVADFIQAARRIRSIRGDQVRFALVGAPDPGNPDCITADQLAAWANEGEVEWWGQRNDMPRVMQKAAVVVLPTTYGEGLPKVLLEASASGRPVLAYDVPGCREAVSHGTTGYLIPPGDVRRLAQAIEELIDDPALRAKFGAAGRRRIEAGFSEERVISDTLRVYDTLLSTGSRYL